MTESNDFINDLCAGMSGVSTSEYKQYQQNLLDKLDKIVTIVREGVVNSWESFDKFHAIKSALCSLSCYTFNNKLPQNDEVWKIEGECGRKLSAWMRKQLAKPEENRMIRYLLWNRYYMEDTNVRQRLMDHLIEKGLLFKHEDSYYLKGIYTKVGDNVFTVGRNGRKARQYINVCLPQYYSVNPKDEDYLRTKDVPTIDNIHRYTRTWMGDGKGGARHPKVTYKDWRTLEAFAA